MEHSKRSSKNELHSNKNRTLTNKISNNLNLWLKEQEKEEQTKPKVSRRKEITQIKAEINEKETIEKINEKSVVFLKRYAKQTNLQLD